MNNEIVNRFAIAGEAASCERYGNGHINETYLAVSTSGARYILQKINQTVFRDVPALMRNISSVCEFLRARDPDPRHSMRIVPPREGGSFLCDESGAAWRMYDFVEDSLCLEAPETAEDFYQSAVAFGTFQRQLAEFPAETLAETIPHFHDTPDRFRQLHEAADSDPLGRKKLVARELEFAFAREEEAGALVGMLAKGELPLRVTHNDTKLNNVMFDASTRKPLCVIDLDTVMPGLAAYDFGDSIRFGASTAAEDERDLEKVTMSLPLFETFVRGFTSACTTLTANERETLPMGAKLMTLECGIRFLADYLVGDTYFRIHRPDHNLDRCRTQFKLVADMEAKWAEMARIVSKA